MSPQQESLVSILPMSSAGPCAWLMQKQQSSPGASAAGARPLSAPGHEGCTSPSVSHSSAYTSQPAPGSGKPTIDMEAAAGAFQTMSGRAGRLLGCQGHDSLSHTLTSPAVGRWHAWHWHPWEAGNCAWRNVQIALETLGRPDCWVCIRGRSGRVLGH